MKILKLDKIDSKLLYYLEESARAPLSKIASWTRTSQQVVDYRLKKLISSGLIQRIAGLVEYRALGYTQYGLLVRFMNIDEERIMKLVDALKARKRVNIFYRTIGKWDMVIGILAKNMWEASNEISEIEKGFGDFIKDKDVMVHIGRYYKGRQYLLKEEPKIKKQKKMTGANVPIFDIDEKELGILRCLENDARIPIIKIAEKVDLNPEVTRLKIKELFEKGVFVGGFLFLDYSLFGRTLYRVLIKLRNLTPEKEAKLLSFAEAKEVVIGTTKMFGPWDYSFEIEVKDDNERDVFLTDLRNTFSEILMDYELLSIHYEKWRTII